MGQEEQVPADVDRQQCYRHDAQTEDLTAGKHDNSIVLILAQTIVDYGHKL